MKNKLKMRLSHWIAATILFCTPCTAFASAQLVRVKVDPGTFLGFAFSDADFNSIDRGAQTDADNDGEITLIIPGNAVTGVITKTLNGKKINVRVRLTGGVTYATAQPFEIPTFTDFLGGAAVTTSADVLEFLADGNPFSEGQVVAISGGIATETPWIIFKDGSSLPSDPEAAALAVTNPAMFDALPNFTGSVEVQSFEEFLHLPIVAIPTISRNGIILLLLVLGGAAIRRLRFA